MVEAAEPNNSMNARDNDLIRDRHDHSRDELPPFPRFGSQGQPSFAGLQPDRDGYGHPPQAWAVARWLLRLAAWDGMLPAVVWSLPLVAMQLLPGRRGPVELLGVVLPITAFLIRFFVGVRAIRSNHCGRIFRGLQGISLWAGLFLLLIIDTLQILRLVMPPGAVKNRESLIGLLIFYSIYIVCMAFAMYPGRAPQPAVAADIIRHSERR